MLRAGRDPYNASLYMPYYQGAFDKDGKLIDPTDPMLYWLVPINQRRDDWSSRREYRESRMASGPALGVTSWR